LWLLICRHCGGVVVKEVCTHVPREGKAWLLSVMLPAQNNVTRNVTRRVGPKNLRGPAVVMASARRRK
jgi:hypothetical protein